MLEVYKIVRDLQRSQLFAVSSNVRTWEHQIKIASSKQIEGCVIGTVPSWNSLLQGVGVVNIYVGTAGELTKTKSKEGY